MGGTLEELETKVLTHYDDFILKTEKEVVHQIQLNPHSAYAHYLLSYVYLRMYTLAPSDNALAEKSVYLAQQALELDESGEYGYLAIADSYQTLGFPEKAWATLQHVQKKSWRTLYRTIKHRYDAMDAKSAFHLLEGQVYEHPESRDILIPLILELSKNFDNEALSPALHELNKRISHPLLKQELAVYYISKGRFKDAQTLFEDVLTNGAYKYPEISMNYGMLLLNEIRRYDLSAKVLKNLLSDSTLPKSIRSSSSMYLSLAYMKMSDTEQSVYFLLKAMSDESQQYNTLEYVMTELVKHKPKLFEFYMNAVHNRFPGHAEFYLLQGKLYSDYLGLQNEAQANYANAAILEHEVPSESSIDPLDSQ